MEGERPFVDRYSHDFGKWQAKTDLFDHGYQSCAKYLLPLLLLVVVDIEQGMEVAGTRAVDAADVMYLAVMFLYALVRHFDFVGPVETS